MKKIGTVLIVAISSLVLAHQPGNAKIQRVPCRIYVDSTIDIGESHGNDTAYITFQGRMIPPYKRFIKYQQVLKYGRFRDTYQVDIGWCDVEL